MYKTLRSVLPLVVAFGLFVPGAQALDPDPDWKTLIFPNIVPKAGGSVNQADDSPAGSIRTSYETFYENYWKECSYYRYDPATGDKLRGFNMDTKTFGYVSMPWPLAPRNGGSDEGSGAGEGFSDGVRTLQPNPWPDALNTSIAAPVPDGADADGVWTPGESFRDLNGNGVWDPAGELVTTYRVLYTQPDEDYWNADNSDALVMNSCGQTVTPFFLHDATGTDWNGARGEIFADYNGNGLYDPAVLIYVADPDNGINIAYVINELDLTPMPTALGVFCADNEGDFAHTYVDLGKPGGGADVPVNGTFDFNVDPNTGAPQVPKAKLFDGVTDATLTFPRYEDGAGNAYTNSLASTSNVVTKTVDLYQSGELYHEKYPGANNWYGDLPGGDGTWSEGGNNTPIEGTFGELDGGGCCADFPADGVVVTILETIIAPAFESEPWEDFVSWGGQALEGQPNPRNRGSVITQAGYESYIRWNYQGDAGALILRAGNGVYDGPEAWTEAFNQKASLTGIQEFLAPEPISQAAWDLLGIFADPTVVQPNWAADPSGHPTWQDWWALAFGVDVAAVPAWLGAIPSLNQAYVPNSGASDAGWIPSNTWGYSGSREYCDMPSSMYHVGPDVAAALPPLETPTGGEFGIFGGDGKLGEITSPSSESIFGEDLGAWPILPNNASDGAIISAGPFCYNIHGIHGFDGGNQLTFEYMTWITITNGMDVAIEDYPVTYRDRNLDGILDLGVERTSDPHYSRGNGGDGDPPFNRQRYAEDLVEAMDHAQDYAEFVKRSGADAGEFLPIYLYGIYPMPPGPGEFSMGGPAGATDLILTRDARSPLEITFQIRPIEAGNIDGFTGSTPDSLVVSNVVGGADFAMGILTHEQGHDIMGWPDLYDYDVWNGGVSVLNTPIGGYDLMSGGGLVHGIPDFKIANAGTSDSTNGLPWISEHHIEDVVPLDGGPVELCLKPCEFFYGESYWRFDNPNNPGEYIYLWYSENGTDYAHAGSPGIYISHTDLEAYPNGVPVQQRVNNHFTWEIIQADGLYEMQDGTDPADTGDAFPGDSNKRIFTADTLPAARWWDQTDMGLRILDITLPTVSGESACIMIERFDTLAEWPTVDPASSDLDGDGMPDAWEVHYFGDTTTADANTDFDFDGVIDVDEYTLGLDPTNPNDALMFLGLLPTDCPVNGSLDLGQFPWEFNAKNTATGKIYTRAANPDKFWTCQSDEVSTGQEAVQVGTRPDPLAPLLGDSELSWMRTRVIGPGEICFDVKVDVEPHITTNHSDPADYFYFIVDGAVKESITGNVDWQNICKTIPGAAVHYVKWSYNKDDYLAMGEDAVWVDNVIFTHTGPDTDGDGLPNAYENLVYGTNPSLADSDGDLIPDYEEVLLGTDPTVSNAALGGFLTPDAYGRIGMDWMGMAGTRYIVQRSYDLVNWVIAPNGVTDNELSIRTAAADGLQEYRDVDSSNNPAPFIFYRVIAQP